MCGQLGEEMYNQYHPSAEESMNEDSPEHARKRHLEGRTSRTISELRADLTLKNDFLLRAVSEKGEDELALNAILQKGITEEQILRVVEGVYGMTVPYREREESYYTAERIQDELGLNLRGTLRALLDFVGYLESETLEGRLSEEQKSQYIREIGTVEINTLCSVSGFRAARPDLFRSKGQ